MFLMMSDNIARNT